MALMLSVEDYRRKAKRRLPRIAFDYVDGGAETESTVRGNAEAFRQVTFRPHGGHDPATVDLTTEFCGMTLSMPLFVAPCGMSRVIHPGGDAAGASAANAMGTLFVQSAMSGHSVAEVVAAAGGSPVWFQTYFVRDRPTTERAIAGARDAGAAALVITLDTATNSLRERDRRSGGLGLLGSRAKAAPHAAKLLAHPGWLAGRIGDGLRPRLKNIVDEHGEAAILGQQSYARGIGWHDLGWVRDLWDGPIVFKGVLSPDDARHAVAEGAIAVIVSNHGGRQLDGAEATLRALPEIAATVDGACPVVLDGGVRSGPDVLKALCLGASAVEIGRPWVWGLANGGRQGVIDVLQLLKDGIARNLALLGASRPSDLDGSFVRVPSDWWMPQDHLAPVANLHPAGVGRVSD